MVPKVVAFSLVTPISSLLFFFFFPFPSLAGPCFFICLSNPGPLVPHNRTPESDLEGWTACGEKEEGGKKKLRVPEWKRWHRLQRHISTKIVLLPCFNFGGLYLAIVSLAAACRRKLIAGLLLLLLVTLRSAWGNVYNLQCASLCSRHHGSVLWCSCPSHPLSTSPASANTAKRRPAVKSFNREIHSNDGHHQGGRRHGRPSPDQLGRSGQGAVLDEAQSAPNVHFPVLVLHGG